MNRMCGRADCAWRGDAPRRSILAALSLPGPRVAGGRIREYRDGSGGGTSYEAVNRSWRPKHPTLLFQTVALVVRHPE